MKHWRFRIVLVLILGVVTTWAVAWACAYQFDWRPGDETHIPNEAQIEAWNASAPSSFDSELRVVSWVDDRGARLDLWTGLRNDTSATVEWDVDEDGHVYGSSTSYSDRSPAFDQVLAMTAGWPLHALDAQRTMAKAGIHTLSSAHAALQASCPRCGMLLRSPNCMLCTHPLRRNTPVTIQIDDSWAIVVSKPVQPMPEMRILPLRPLFLGFLINTLFYAGLWFALIFGFSITRSTIRRKRGRCGHCGYDLRGRADDRDVCPECGTSQ